MKKTLVGMMTVVAMAFLSGCASNGSFQEKAGVFGSKVGDFAVQAVDVAKQVGGNLVPGDYITGVHVSEETLASLKPGMTTAEVEVLIGPAPDVSALNGGEVWKFPYARIPHFGTNINETTIVRFDANQRLVKAYKVQGGGAAASGHPLLQAAEEGGYL